MLDLETNIAMQAEYSRDRRRKLAVFNGTSWLSPLRKLSLFGEAYPLSEWPVDEFAIVAALIAVIGIVGLLAF
ncbi:hypothetical protein [Devosia psychrophila]|uniref:Uncharacterized protein n=1 Tax=Devosia psychrophila TaxID=728005 RepID=A0A0F5Q009_9HYPH|nr:hypothetical protein [Devosia psychrophila]KKC33986.1 hypothetical protein WH91_05395 [Devosia psychrophila]SFD40314.1 hypothetical protein SAMN04488059_1532 [Devosia psychrophila]